MEEITLPPVDEGAEDSVTSAIDLDVDSAYGEALELEGRYEVDPVAGGKRFQGVWLVLDDGTRHLLAYRPVPEGFQFIDKRVRVRGRPYLPGSDVQHIETMHLAVDAIELAPGETPYLSPPTHPAPPPAAHTGAALAAREGRWVQMVGALQSVEDDPDGYLGVARLRLVDGTQVYVRNVLKGEWSPYLGQWVTATSRVRPEPVVGGEPPAYELFGARQFDASDPGRAGLERPGEQT